MRSKANPGKINMATLGPGSPSQLFGVVFKVMAGVDLVTVNYRGIGRSLERPSRGHLHLDCLDN
jgi:tripartite-type tricarboxylate transporter receptor subunit TctC